jgi:hypothetical protein
MPGYMMGLPENLTAFIGKSLLLEWATFEAYFRLKVW